MTAFRPYKDRPEVSMTYFTIPADVLDDAEELVTWARRRSDRRRAQAETQAQESKTGRAEKEGEARDPGETTLSHHPVGPAKRRCKVNLDPRHYGTFAEIGAGQEVVRWFFRAGGAAGTISKSISAYDMKVSDAIYGPCARYVCRDRLQSMLDHEQHSTSSGCRPSAAPTRRSSRSPTRFRRAASAATTNATAGWASSSRRGPAEPTTRSSSTCACSTSRTRLQQEALGIVGVNLVYGACFLTTSRKRCSNRCSMGLSTEPHRDRPHRILRPRASPTSTIG